MGTCPSCGVRRPDDQRFCASCGASQEPTASDVTGDERHDESGDDSGPDPAPDALFAGRAATVGMARPRPGDGTASPEPVGAATEVVTLTGGVDLSRCPACEAVNAVERRRCARCGTAMGGGVVDDWPSDDALPLPHDAAAGSVPDTRAGRGARDGGPRGMGVAIVVVGAIVGALLATWAVGLGPFARVTGPGVDFDGEAYSGQASPLRPATATTSTVRPPSDGRAFTADLAVDGRADTAWVAVDGEDATLEFAFDQPVWITAMEVANGDQHDEESFDATARVRILGVDAGFRSRVEATLISGTGRQGFRPPMPLLTDRVVLDVVTTTEGEDVALSEVTFVGFPADATDAAEYDAAGG